jgi:hypothetical protein
MEKDEIEKIHAVLKAINEQVAAGTPIEALKGQIVDVLVIAADAESEREEIALFVGTVVEGVKLAGKILQAAPTAGALAGIREAAQVGVNVPMTREQAEAFAATLPDPVGPLVFSADDSNADAYVNLEMSIAARGKLHTVTLRAAKTESLAVDGERAAREAGGIFGEAVAFDRVSDATANDIAACYTERGIELRDTPKITVSAASEPTASEGDEADGPH